MTPEAQITAAFLEISQSLRRLLPPTAEDHNAQANAAIIRSIEDALVGMVPKVVFGEKAIRTAFNTNSARIVHAVATRLGKDRIRETKHQGDYHLNDVIRVGNLETLKALHELGFPIASMAPKMVPHAFRHKNLAYLDFIRNSLGYKSPIHDLVDIRKIISDCSEVLADTVAAEMKPDLCDPRSDLVRNFSKLRALDLKGIAILVFTRRDLGQIIEQDQILSLNNPSAAAVFQRSRSSHGRLTLMRDEPDLASVLARNPRGSFFGLLEDPQNTQTPNW